MPSLLLLLPFSASPPAGFELLYQPDVVRLYLSILTESQNFNTLEAAAGALQNLSAGNWTVSVVFSLVSFISFVQAKNKATSIASAL